VQPISVFQRVLSTAVLGSVLLLLSCAEIGDIKNLVSCAVPLTELREEVAECMCLFVVTSSRRANLVLRTCLTIQMASLTQRTITKVSCGASIFDCRFHSPFHTKISTPFCDSLSWQIWTSCPSQAISVMTQTSSVRRLAHLILQSFMFITAYRFGQSAQKISSTQRQD
jgi:hypothetical protein